MGSYTLQIGAVMWEMIERMASDRLVHPLPGIEEVWVKKEYLV